MASTTITLSVRDDGSATIQKVTSKLAQMERQAKDGAAGMSVALAGLKVNWLGLTAGVAGTGLAINRALAFAGRAAEQEEALGRLTHQLQGSGLAAGELARQVQDVIGGQITLADAVRLSRQAMAQGFDPEQITTFTQLAEVASDVLGGSIAQNFDTLVASIATGRTSMLKQIGILVDLEEEEKKKVPAATNRATSEITLMEEKQILLTAATEQAPAAMAKLTAGVTSADDQFKRARAARFVCQRVSSAGAADCGADVAGADPRGAGEAGGEGRGYYRGV
jgi:uncharacterized membrane protein